MEEKKVSYYAVTKNDNPYEYSLRATGAEVLAFQDFGSYQGDWFAKVRNGGEEYWIQDSYGSCSGCDAFQSEVDYEDRTEEEWTTFFKEFGEKYLGEKKNKEELIAKFKDQSSWDGDAKEILEFLEAN